jgi:hypothetical protein
MLSIAAEDQPCNGVGMIWRKGFGRSGSLASIVTAGSIGTWGARVLIPARMTVPSLNMLSDLRVNQWIAHLHRSLLQATDSITGTSAHGRQLAVSNGLWILLVRGYDNLHHIKDDDLKLLSVRWSKRTDALAAALCSLGVFSRTPCARAAKEKCGPGFSTHAGQPRAQPGGRAKSQRTCRTDCRPRDRDCQDQRSIAESRRTGR